MFSCLSLWGPARLGRKCWARFSSLNRLPRQIPIAGVKRVQFPKAEMKIFAIGFMTDEPACRVMVDIGRSLVLAPASEDIEGFIK